MVTLLFDIGGVILPEDELYAHMFGSARRALRKADVKVSDKEFDAAIYKCILSFVPDLRKSLIWHFTKPDIDKFTAAEREVRWDVSPRIPINGIRELLEELSGYCKLALAANANGGIRDVLANHNILRFFESTQVSGDLPFAKPDPRFFEHILENCSVDAGNAIMIGDRLDNDIIPAKKMGMRTILYKAGPYAILEPRTPDEIPDATVSSVEELRRSLLSIVAA